MRETIKYIALGAVTVACIASQMPVSAQSANFPALGVYKAASCNGATSIFQKSHGVDKEYDIGNTKMKSVLVNAGDEQVAGLHVVYTYSAQDQSDFATYLINFIDDGRVRDDVKVHFCFRNENTGVVQGFDKNLTDFRIQNAQLGNWKFGVIRADAFAFPPDNKRQLVKVTFKLADQGNIQFGDSKIGLRGRTTFSSNTIDLSQNLPCNALGNCVDVNGP